MLGLFNVKTVLSRFCRVSGRGWGGRERREPRTALHSPADGRGSGSAPGPALRAVPRSPATPPKLVGNINKVVGGASQQIDN